MEIASDTAVVDINEFPPGTRRLEETHHDAVKIVLNPSPTDDPNDPLVCNNPSNLNVDLLTVTR